MKYDTLILDVDGVMTDGTVTYTNNGDRLLAFSRIDGYGLEKLRRSGVKIAIITGSDDAAITDRVCDIKAIKVAIGTTDKLRAAGELFIDLARAVVCGDDEPDEPLMRAAARAYTPMGSWLDQHRDAEKWCEVVWELPGDGFVREVCERIIKENAECQ